MASDTNTLEEMCELVVDCPHSTPKWTDDGIIVLRNQNIRNGVLDLSSPSYTNEEDYKKRIKRAVPQEGDIVFTREAPMGEVCILPNDLKCCLGQRQVLLRPKKSVSGKYLFWALQSPTVKHQISWNEGTGTTVSNVRIPVLKALQIPRLHGLEDKVAMIMSSIADKIELNKKINQTLEQMAQALFKSWFVDFDPVFDNLLDKHDNNLEKAKAYLESKGAEDLCPKLTKCYEQRQQIKDQKPLPQDIRNLFPSDFHHDQDLGWIPEGWEKGKLGDISKFSNGRVEVSSLTLETYISTENMLANKKGISKVSSLPTVKTVPFFKSGDILVSNIRPYFKKIWLASFDGGRSGDVLGFVSKKEENKEYLYNLLYQDSFFDFMMLTSKGAKMPRGDKKAIMDYEVVVPEANLMSSYSKLVRDFYKYIDMHGKENETLDNVRNILLPKLISGELRLESHDKAQDKQA